VGFDACYVGASCRVTIDGASLLGVSVSTADPRIMVSDCRGDCMRVTCVVSATPTAPLGAAELLLTTPLGSTQGEVEILPPPATDSAGQADVWHFAANGGDLVTVAMTRIGNQPDGSSSLDPAIDLRDSRGFLVASDDDSGTEAPPGPGRNAAIMNLSLPSTDTFRVTARGAGGTFGPYVLEITPPTIVLVPGEIIEPPRDRETLVAGEISGIAERDSVSFAADRGERIFIEARRLANHDDGRGSLDPGLELRDSRNFLIASDTDTGTNDPPGPGRNALIPNLFVEATDTYRIVVFGESGSRGPYELRITVRAQASPSQAADRQIIFKDFDPRGGS
jgi:hypothetical protein